MEDTVWIIANDKRASKLQRRLENAGAHSDVVLRWVVTARAGDPQDTPLWANLACVIPVIDKCTLEDDAMRGVLWELIGAMSFRSDLIVIPWLDGLTISELESAATDKRVAAEIVDNIQLVAEMETVDGVAALLEDHLKAREVLRAADRWEGILRGLVRDAGRAARMVALAAVAFGVLSGAAELKLLPIRFVSLGRTDDDLMVILNVAALVVIFFSVLNLYTFMRGGGELRKRTLQSTIAFSCFCWAGYFAYISMRGLVTDSLANIVIGVLFGISLESITRAGRRTKPRFMHFAMAPVRMKYRDQFDDMLSALYDYVARCWIRNGRRFFEPMHKRAFISYSRSSAWSRGVAARTAEHLRGQGVYVYLDRLSLQPGYSWQRQIQRAIEGANVFVIVLDKAACDREWIAAEFLTAYARRIASGVPEIFIVRAPDLDFAKLEGSPSADLFFEITQKLAGKTPDRMRVRLETYSDESLHDLCAEISTFPISGAIGRLANMLAPPIMAILTIPLLLLMVLGLLLLAALPFFMGFGVAGMFLQHAGFITPIAVFCALEIGACLRSAVSSFSELKRSGYGSGPGYIKLGAAVGFGMPLAYIASHCLPCRAYASWFLRSTRARSLPTTTVS
jgi:uncharacterized membrane protein YvlD (DUF360 family)